jgi:hypothetical protein
MPMLLWTGFFGMAKKVDAKVNIMVMTMKYCFLPKAVFSVTAELDFGLPCHYHIFLG